MIMRNLLKFDYCLIALMCVLCIPILGLQEAMQRIMDRVKEAGSFLPAKKSINIRKNIEFVICGEA